jgi:Arc/MetJ-type ribon-helix-helix transcriptional regulator
MNTITTVNISLPTPMYEEAKRYVKRRGYASISELIRDAVRDWLYPKVTVNGFTPKFEKEVLKAASEPMENDIVLNSEKDIHDYFKNPTKFKKTKS